jgi:malic enzyme
MHYRPEKNEHGEQVLKVDKTGQDVIHNPLLNKGTAFTEEDRRDFGLEGLMPPHISTMEEQLIRVKENFDRKQDNIEKYIFLRALQERNETLFYALVGRNITEMLPIIYTPTVGEAVEKYGHIYRIGRGLYITPGNVASMNKMAVNLPIPPEDVEIIVVTDSEGILGIGDQGVGGMGIPIGKLSLYTVGGGIHPATCLPICLDVGTNNQKLLADPLYLGLRRERIRGEEYDDFIEKFVEGVKRNFPNAILQWEDFSKQNAFKNLDVYKDAHPSFNDDIQGTGAIVLAGIVGAMKIKKEKLADQFFAVYGAGAAGIGISRQLKNALMLEGFSEQDASDRVYVVDSKGLITEERGDAEGYKKEFAKPHAITEKWVIDNLYQHTLHDVVRNAHITVLIGVSAQKGAFNKDILDAMLENSPKPVIFPLSNPTSRAEADPRWLLEQTSGSAIVASGSPFDPVTIKGRLYHIGQGNNALVFPGIGLGALVAGARVIKPSFFSVAAHAVAGCVPQERLADGIVFPDFEDLFEISFNVALAVYHQAVKEGVGSPVEGDPEQAIRDKMWTHTYARYVK